MSYVWWHGAVHVCDIVVGVVGTSWLAESNLKISLCWVRKQLLQINPSTVFLVHVCRISLRYGEVLYKGCNIPFRFLAKFPENPGEHPIEICLDEVSKDLSEYKTCLNIQ